MLNHLKSSLAATAIALTLAGCGEEAIAAATDLVEAAQANDNPHALSFALLAHGFAFRDAPTAHAKPCAGAW